jgi:MFS family permease
MHDDARAKRAVAILVWAQSILGAQMPVHFILGGLAGQMLSSDPALATLPISLTVFGSMCAAPFISTLMGRYGRRTGFILGALAGATASTLATYAIYEKDFVLFAAASFILGIYMSAHGFYRFAAADSASPAFRPKAISWVMAGGLVAALLGPELVKQFKDWMEPVPFAGGYKILIFVNLIGLIPLFFLDLPRQPRPAKGERAGRPWRESAAPRRRQSPPRRQRRSERRFLRDHHCRCAVPMTGCSRA